MCFILPLLLVSSLDWSAESLVVGTVVSVVPAPSVISIRRVFLTGNRPSRLESYRVRSAAALLSLRPGDKIMAVVSAQDGTLRVVKHSRNASGGVAIGSP